MKLSTKGRYAIMAMMEEALNQKTRPVTLADISEEQGISISYLEQLFARLRKNGLVKGTRGPGGGYCLARPANEITIADIVTTVEDKLPVKHPVSAADAPNSTRSIIFRTWEKLSQQIYDYLSTITLAQFMEPQAQEDSGNQNNSSNEDESAPQLKIIGGNQLFTNNG